MNRKYRFFGKLLIGLASSIGICLLVLGAFYFAWSLTFDLKDVG